MAAEALAELPAYLGGSRLGDRHKTQIGSLSTTPEAGEPEPTLYKSIRTILARDPAYASQLIFEIERLPRHRRSILLAPHCTYAAGPPGASKKDGTPSDGTDNKSQASSGRNQGSYGEWGGDSSGSFVRNSKKRQASSHGQRDRDPDEDSKEGDDDHDNGPPATKQMKTNKEIQRWICPFRHAFPSIDTITRFNTCRPCGNLTSRKRWA